tara:strand:+ start:1406 stop:2350 length:945 start_codon:yes stop_codon:yes gene_type:complete
MFRNFKEYQDIAKIYTEKVSKPENLDENRNKRAAELRQKREKNQKVETPRVKSNYQKNRDKLIQSRQNQNKGRAEKQFSVLKAKPGSQGRVSRSSQNMSGKPKPMPTTAEIRAKNPNVVSGTRVNEIGAKGGGKPSSGDLSMFKDKKPEAKPEISKFTKQGKPRTKAQMMAAKRIGSGTAKNPDTTIAQVKQSNQDSMRARAKERFAAFKAKRAEKKAAMVAKEEFTPYDIVLEYLLSTEQVATIEEANYVMTEMDAETIQDIVEMDRMGGPAAVGAILGAGAVLAKPVVNAVKSVTNLGKKLKKKSEEQMNPK